MPKKIDKIANDIRRLDTATHVGVSNLDIVKDCIRRWYQGFYDRDPTEAEMTEALLRAGSEVIVVFGVVYDSLSAACRANGVGPTSARTRMKGQNETLEEAITVLMTKVVVFGVGYKSEAAACRANGVGRTSARNRTKGQNETLEEAITALLTKTPFVVFGVSYDTETAACSANGVGRTSARTRMKGQNETLEEAITHLLKHKEEKEAKAAAQQRTPKHEPQNQIHC